MFQTKAEHTIISSTYMYRNDKMEKKEKQDLEKGFTLIAKFHILSINYIPVFLNATSCLSHSSEVGTIERENRVKEATGEGRKEEL